MLGSSAAVPARESDHVSLRPTFERHVRRRMLQGLRPLQSRPQTHPARPQRHRYLFICSPRIYSSSKFGFDLTLLSNVLGWLSFQLLFSAFLFEIFRFCLFVTGGVYIELIYYFTIFGFELINKSFVHSFIFLLI